MAITLPALRPAQESLFLTLGGKALDSRLPRPFLGDPVATEIVARTGYDISRFPSLGTRLIDTKNKVFDIVVRAKRLDEVVQRFVTRHENAVVLDLGVGLDSRMLRVDPPATVDWYDVDFPEVIDLREQVLPPRAGAHYVGADVTDPHWLDDVPADRPTVIVADGLIGFLTHDDLVTLLRRLTDHFPGGELAFNAYTTFAAWVVKRARVIPAIVDDFANPGFNDPHEPERWVPTLELVDEIFLTRAPEVAEFNAPQRLGIRLLARSQKMSRMLGTTLLRYRF